MIELAPEGRNMAHLGVAGDTFNTAVYIKRNAPDIDVDYITRLGDDPFSQRIRLAIADENIGTSAIEVQAGGTPGLYAITTTEDGERSFTYWRGQSAARGLFQRAGEADFSVVDGYDMVYLSGISLAILPPRIRDGLLEHLRAQGIPFAFDSNFRPKLWEDRSVAQECMSRWFGHAAIVLPSVDDEMALHDETADAVAARFGALDARGAIKRGAQGPLSLGEPVTQSYAPAPRVVDTTAAGDSFNGAYLAAVLRELSQAEALMAAHCCAAEVVQYRGAILPRGPKSGDT